MLLLVTYIYYYNYLYYYTGIMHQCIHINRLMRFAHIHVRRYECTSIARLM